MANQQNPPHPKRTPLRNHKVFVFSGPKWRETNGYFRGTLGGGKVID